VADSSCHPKESDSKYPYTSDGDRHFLEGKPFIEPFVLMAALGAVTEKLRLTTFVVKLPIRQPVLVAKQASLSVMIGERSAFGVGLSPWSEDFTVTGTEWSNRGACMDEMIEIIRGITSGAFFSYQGKHDRIPSLQICPVPNRPIPSLIGGCTPAATPPRSTATSPGSMRCAANAAAKSCPSRST